MCEVCVSYRCVQSTESVCAVGQGCASVNATESHSDHHEAKNQRRRRGALRSIGQLLQGQSIPFDHNQTNLYWRHGVDTTVHYRERQDTQQAFMFDLCLPVNVFVLMLLWQNTHTAGSTGSGVELSH